MTGRFKISNHRGISLTHRSADFLNYNSREKSSLPTGKTGDTISKIEENRRWDRILRPLAFAVALTFLFLFTLFIKSITMANYTPIHEDTEWKKRMDHKANETMSMVLSCGYVELEKGNYSAAQREFELYMLNEPMDIVGALGMAYTLVNRCELDKAYCERAVEYIDYARTVNFGRHSILYEGSIVLLENRMDELSY